MGRTGQTNPQESKYTEDRKPAINVVTRGNARLVTSTDLNGSAPVETVLGKFHSTHQMVVDAGKWSEAMKKKVAELEAECGKKLAPVLSGFTSIDDCKSVIVFEIYEPERPARDFGKFKSE